jgi:hypothetical protein
MSATLAFALALSQAFFAPAGVHRHLGLAPASLAPAGVRNHLAASRSSGVRAAAAPSEEEADAMLVRAGEALSSGDLSEAAALVETARGAYPAGHDRLVLADMIQSCVDGASRNAAPPSGEAPS